MPSADAGGDGADDDMNEGGDEEEEDAADGEENDVPQTTKPAASLNPFGAKAKSAAGGTSTLKGPKRTLPVTGAVGGKKMKKA